MKKIDTNIINLSGYGYINYIKRISCDNSKTNELFIGNKIIPFIDSNNDEIHYYICYYKDLFLKVNNKYVCLTDMADFNKLLQYFVFAGTEEALIQKTHQACAPFEEFDDEKNVPMILQPLHLSDSSFDTIGDKVKFLNKINKIINKKIKPNLMHVADSNKVKLGYIELSHYNFDNSIGNVLCDKNGIDIAYTKVYKKTK